jgi:hypothetical protein
MQKSQPSFSTTCCRVWWPEATNIPSDNRSPLLVGTAHQNMKHIINNSIGSIFTQNWLKDQNNHKLEGFNKSAELCLRDVRSYNLGQFIMILVIILGFIMPSIQHGAMIISVGIFFGWANSKLFSLGSTTKKIAEKWKPFHKQLKSFGIIRRIHLELKKKKFDFIPENEIRQLLVKAFDAEMSSLGRKLRGAQQEGFPEKEKIFVAKMQQLEEMPKQLGILMNFDSHKTIKVIFRHRGDEAV